jgi:aubergine-like protein
MQMDRTSNYVDAIRSECSKREFSLIFCVLRNARADTYSSIKKLTCAEFGIPSQVSLVFWGIPEIIRISSITKVPLI